ncbi:MAG TPA: TIR domain-containing protein, partial [Acidimicrobiia bacterium]
MSDVFVSYARENQAFVRWLVEALTQQGRDVWVDWEGIIPSAKWRDELREGIEAADSFIFVVSQHSLESDICREELGHAAALNKRILPLLLEDPNVGALPEAVESHDWILCRTDAERDENFPRIVAALDTDLDWVKAHTRLLVRSLEWESRGEARSVLLRGEDLSDTETTLQVHAESRPSPTSLQRRFTLVSRQSATRRLRRLVAIAVTGAVVIAVLGVVAVVQAVQAHHTAQLALSRQLAAYSNTVLSTDPQLSLLLALQAYDTNPTIEAQAAVRQATMANHERAALRGDTDIVYGVAFSPNGHDVVTGSADDTVRVWNWSRADESPVVLRGDSDSVTAVAFSPDGTHVAATSSDDTARVWDWEQPRAPATVLRLDGAGTGVAFSPDGNELAVSTGAGTTAVWSWRTPALAPVTMRIGAAATGVAFNPDGEHVAVASSDATARVFDWRTPTSAPDVVHLGGVVNGVAFSPDGNDLATAGRDGTAQVWDWRQPASALATLRVPAQVQGVAFSPDGSAVAVASLDRTARVWRWQAGTTTTPEVFL